MPDWTATLENVPRFFDSVINIIIKVKYVVVKVLHVKH